MKFNLAESSDKKNILKQPKENQNLFLVPPQRRAYQSLVGKDVRQIQSSKKSLEVEGEDIILNINCMNCQELIHISAIEAHSKFCTTLTEDVKKIDSTSYLNQTFFRLRKLEAFLTEMNKTPDLKPGDKNYISIILRLCLKLTNNNYFSEIDYVLQSLSSLLISFRGSRTINLYADRLQSLAQELKIAIKEQEIEEKKKELAYFTEETEKKRRSIDNLESNLSKSLKIDQKKNTRFEIISSELGSLKSANSEFSNNSVQDDEKEDFEEFVVNSSDDQRKNFYGLCLAFKLKFTGKNSVQNISVKKVYQKALSENIPEKSWPDFIMKELMDPSNWESKKIFRRNLVQKKQTLASPQYFEVIVEENDN
jgi:hypothetical protein